MLRSELMAKRYDLMDTCRYYSNQMKRLSEIEQDSSLYAEALVFEGFNDAFHFDNYSGYTKIMNAVDILHRNSSDNLPMAFAFLSYYFLKTGNKELTFNYARKAVNLSQHISDSMQISISYHYLGTAFYSMGWKKDTLEHVENIDSSVFYLKKAIKWAPNVYQKIVSISNLGQAYYFINRRLNRSLGNPHQYFEQAYQLSLQSGFDWGLVENSISLGLWAKRNNRLEDAIAYFDMGIPLARKIGDKWSLEQLLQHKIRIMQSADSSENEVVHEIGKMVLQMRNLSNQRMNKNFQDELAKLETEYQVSRKEEELAMKNKTIAWQKKMFVIFGVLLVLIIALAVYLYYLFRLNKALSGKNEVLLKEQNHRVKNNLQMISSLLSLQSQKLMSSDAKEALSDSQSRVNSVALLHRMLYQGEQIGIVNMKLYLETLIEEITYSVHRDFHYELKVQKEVNLPVEKSTSIALIVNELVTNSVKHTEGLNKLTVRIHLGNEDEQLVLTYEDNGPGVSSEVWERSTSFGNQLVRIQSLQLKGIYNIDGIPGFKYQLRIPA